MSDLLDTINCPRCGLGIDVHVPSRYVDHAGRAAVPEPVERSVGRRQSRAQEGQRRDMSVKRWHAYIEDDDGNDLFVSHQQDAQGQWVRYDDHAAEVERLRAALREEQGESLAQAEIARDALAEVARLKAREQELEALLRTLLGLHDAEVFVREPWDTTFNEVRAAVSAEVPDGHTHMTDGITPSEPTEWLEDLNAVSAEKEDDDGK